MERRAAALLFAVDDGGRLGRLPDTLLLREGDEQIGVSNKTYVEQDAPEQLSAAALLAERKIEVGLGYQLLGDEDLAEATAPALRVRNERGCTSRRSEGRQRLGQLAHGLEALGRIALKRVEHHAGEVLRQIRTQVDGPRDRIGHDLGDDRHGGALEGRPPGEKLEQDDAERPDVAPRVGGDRLAQLLGRGVRGGAEVARATP